MHYEYAVEVSMENIEGYPQWWVLTDWRRRQDDAKRDFERFMLRNRNEEIDPPILAHRMVRRAVGEIKVVCATAQEGGDK